MLFVLNYSIFTIQSFRSSIFQFDIVYSDLRYRPLCCSNHRDCLLCFLSLMYIDVDMLYLFLIVYSPIKLRNVMIYLEVSPARISTQVSYFFITETTIFDISTIQISTCSTDPGISYYFMCRYFFHQITMWTGIACDGKVNVKTYNDKANIEKFSLKKSKENAIVNNISYM